jgi:hypothetical protein
VVPSSNSSNLSGKSLWPCSADFFTLSVDPALFNS